MALCREPHMTCRRERAPCEHHRRHRLSRSPEIHSIQLVIPRAARLGGGRSHGTGVAVAVVVGCALSRIPRPPLARTWATAAWCTRTTGLWTSPKRTTTLRLRASAPRVGKAARFQCCAPHAPGASGLQGLYPALSRAVRTGEGGRAKSSKKARALSNTFVYRDRLRHSWALGRLVLEVDLDDLVAFDPQLANLLLDRPSDFLPLLEEVAATTAREEFAEPTGAPAPSQTVQVQLRSSGNCVPIRQLRCAPSLGGVLVCSQCVVLRTCRASSWSRASSSAPRECRQRLRICSCAARITSASTSARYCRELQRSLISFS